MPTEYKLVLIADGFVTKAEDLSPPECCGHGWGCHECGLCQVVLNEGDYGSEPIFCPCPNNVE